MKLLNNKGQAILSPGMIMSIVVALIVLGVGVYALYTTTGSIPTADAPRTAMAINNTTDTASSVINILGIVMTIGAIMLIVSMVMSLGRRD